MTENNIFLDTNILIYSIDLEYPSNQKMALKILEDALTDVFHAMISPQVLIESYAVMVKRFHERFTAEASLRIIKNFSTLTIIHPSVETIFWSIETQQKYHISIWDALIVQSARKGNCRYIYSEDLSHKETIEGVTIWNPFKHGIIKP